MQTLERCLEGLEQRTDPVQGKFGMALSFDGVDDYVEVADDPSLRFMRSGSFTISASFVPPWDSLRS